MPEPEADGKGEWTPEPTHARVNDHAGRREDARWDGNALGDEVVTACVANIGPRGCHQRLITGIALLVIGGSLVVVLVGTGQPRLWRILAFIPFWIGAFGIFQAREKTCAILAARGQRKLDQGVEAIEDPAELILVHRQGRRVHLRTFLTAMGLTAGALLWPG